MNGMYETPGIAQMVEREWNKWLLLTHQQASDRAPLLPTVTVSREKGSGGSSIARLVADQLGFVFFDKEIVDEVARSASVDRLVVERLDERSRHSIKESTDHAMRRHAFSLDTYIAHLTKTILTIGEKGRAVLVGRGAHLLIPVERCFRVRVVAPIELRLERVSTAAGLERSVAEGVITDTDGQRSQFVQEHFHQSDANPLLFDLVINTGGITVKTAAALVVSAVQARFPDVSKIPAIQPRAGVRP
jgi:cytidylate kinase